MINVRESVIQKNIIDYLEYRKIPYRRVNTVNGDKVGFPDVIAFYNGQLIGLETKREKRGKISKAQDVWHEIFVSNGFEHIYPTSTEQVRDVLKQIDKEKDG